MKDLLIIFKNRIILSREKKITKLCGLISDDCQIKNKFNATKIVAIIEYLTSVKFFAKIKVKIMEPDPKTRDTDLKFSI